MVGNLELKLREICHVTDGPLEYLYGNFCCHIAMVPPDQLYRQTIVAIDGITAASPQVILLHFSLLHVTNVAAT